METTKNPLAIITKNKKVSAIIFITVAAIIVISLLLITRKPYNIDNPKNVTDLVAAAITNAVNQQDLSTKQTKKALSCSMKYVEPIVKSFTNKEITPVKKYFDIKKSDPEANIQVLETTVASIVGYKIIKYGVKNDDLSTNSIAKCVESVTGNIAALTALQ